MHIIAAIVKKNFASHAQVYMYELQKLSVANSSKYLLLEPFPGKKFEPYTIIILQSPLRISSHQNK